MAAFDNVPVKLKNLPVDLHLDCQIFSRKSGEIENPDDEYSLLCESQTITQTLIDRLKRSVFPANSVYIPRPRVIEDLFDKGHLVGFTDEEVKAIRNGENPWEAAKAAMPVPIAPSPKKTVAVKGTDKGSNAKFFQEKFKIQRFGEVINLYNKTKDITEDMLGAITKTGKIDKEQSAVISNDVQNQVNTTDVSMIIRAINRIRTENEYLHTHCLNVAFLNGLMGRWMLFDPVRQNELVETGLFHDIGKLSISAEILNKPGELTKEEFEEMKKHPVLSMETLMKSGVRNKAVLEGVMQHHERINGTGYPRGLVSGKICEYARITAISDTYDAMVTKRFHNDSHSPFVILDEFAQGGYSELDIKYVNVFINCMVDELQGKEIVLNDGSEAVVLFVNPQRLLYPIVEINGKVVTTDNSLYCVRMKSMLG